LQGLSLCAALTLSAATEEEQPEQKDDSERSPGHPEEGWDEDFAFEMLAGFR
jgi:hypothetical protein